MDEVSRGGKTIQNVGCTVPQGSQLSSSVHLPLLPDCRWNVIGCLKLLLLLSFPCHDRLCPELSQSEISLRYFCPIFRHHSEASN